MGDASTILSEAEARHLLQRTGFGASARSLRRLVGRRGVSRGAAVEKLLRFRPRPVRFRTDDVREAQDRWLAHMIRTRTPLQEKLVLFWHDHFATAYDTVRNTVFMTRQNDLLHRHCKGDFKAFVHAMNRDIAMMEFLDTVRNRKESPNENYARELMELFTLGVKDRAGNPTYTQADIVQIARAFTGWRYDVPRRRDVRLYEKAEVSFHEGRHDFMEDFPERGPKVIFQSTGGFGPAGRSFAAAGEGEGEIDAVIEILFAHRDSDGASTVARRIASRLLEYFAHPEPETVVVDEVVAAAGFDVTWSVADLLRAIFVHDAFYRTAARSLDAGTPKSVKWPVDYVVGTLRQLQMRPKLDREDGLRVEGGSGSRIRDHLADMGQQLFNPPSVFGWDWEIGWLSSATLLARYVFARDVAGARGRGRGAFRAKKLLSLRLRDPDAIVDAVTDALGVTGHLSTDERAALLDYLTDGGLTPSIDLADDDVRHEKLHGLVALVLQAPAYQLH